MKAILILGAVLLALGLRLTTRFLAEFSKYRAEAGSPATSKQKEAV